mmetsp:Transcript_24482/g.75519  ORF Transcript_24482/g.75519 Transcript_24482/m.75519 type:complete len:255 (+) Transcript_24482:73-837(+)
MKTLPLLPRPTRSVGDRYVVSSHDVASSPVASAGRKRFTSAKSQRASAVRRPSPPKSSKLSKDTSARRPFAPRENDPLTRIVKPCRKNSSCTSFATRPSDTEKICSGRRSLTSSTMPDALTAFVTPPSDKSSPGVRPATVARSFQRPSSAAAPAPSRRSSTGLWISSWSTASRIFARLPSAHAAIADSSAWRIAPGMKDGNSWKMKAGSRFVSSFWKFDAKFSAATPRDAASTARTTRIASRIGDAARRLDGRR